MAYHSDEPLGPDDTAAEHDLVPEDVDPRANSLVFRRAVWLIWWVGTALIVMSWFRIVTNTIGWIGFAAALASSLASVVANKYWRVPR